MSKSARIVYVILVVLLWVYLGVRAALVPVAHDEAATFLHYLQVNELFPYFSMWDANNHILNTVLAWVSVNVFGDHFFWLRLPNLLFFPLFAWCLFRIVQELEPVVRWIVVLAMLMASFQLEFFALARGYGMGTALLLMAIYHSAQYLKTKSLKHQMWLWVALLFALLANMSLMVSLLVFIGLAAFGAIGAEPAERKRHLFWCAFLGGGLLAVGAFYALKMRALGLLYTGNLEGFAEVTVRSFTRFQFQYDSIGLAWAIIAMGVASIVFLQWAIIRQRIPFGTGNVVAALLLMNANGAIFLANIMGVNYPEERTAIYFLTLFILTAGFAVNRAGLLKPKWQWLAIPLLFFPIQFLNTINVHTTQLWGYLHFDREIYHRAAALQAEANKPLRVSAHRMHELSWAYNNVVYRGGMQLSERVLFPDTTADLLIMRDDMEGWPQLADTLFYNPISGFALLRPHNSENTEEVEAFAIEDKTYSDQSTYFNLMSWSLGDSSAQRGLLSFQFTADSDHHPLNAHIVITANDGEGKTMSYETIPLFWIRKYWRGEQYRVQRIYQFPSGASQAIVYLWNSGDVSARVAFSELHRKQYRPVEKQ